jgi:hypothetical protein
MAIADFNCDGIPDVVVAHAWSNTISVLLGTGDGGFEPRTDFAVGGGPHIIVTGDFNGDGIPDIAAIINGSNTTVSVFLGLGDGTFTNGGSVSVDALANTLAVGDFNGDGKQDLVIGYYQSNIVSVLLGRGNGTFGRRMDFSLGNVTSTYGLAVGDFNGDGKPDIVAANPDENIVTMLLNTTMPPTFTLSATTSGGGSAVPGPLLPSYTNNSLVTVTATPAAGWQFLMWLGDAEGTNQTLSLDMTRNKAVQAVFATQLSGSALMSLNPPADYYPYGTVVKVTALPPVGTYFVSWSGDASGTNNPLSLTVTNPNQSVSYQLGTLNAGEFALSVAESGQGHVTTSP